MKHDPQLLQSGSGLSAGSDLASLKGRRSEKIEQCTETGDPDRRERRYAQRAFASEALAAVDPKASATLFYCGSQRHEADVSLVLRGDGKASVTGLKFCNSVWTCPVCAFRMAAERAAEMQALERAALAAGLAVVLMTLTAWHGPKTNTKQFLKGMKEAARMMRRSHTWAGLPIEGTVTRTETLLGDEGFHTHLHQIVLMKCPEDEALALLRPLRAEWKRSLKKNNLSCGRAGFDVRGGAYVSAYIAKGGFAEEMTLGHLKTGRKGGRTNWELLRDAERGDAVAKARWIEFAQAFKGQKQLTWSVGLKERFAIEETVSAEQAAAEVVEVAPVVLRVWPWADRDAWRQARRRMCALVRAAESGGDLDSAEFGPTDQERWLAENPRPGPARPEPVEGVQRHLRSLSRMMEAQGFAPLVAL